MIVNNKVILTLWLVTGAVIVLICLIAFLLFVYIFLPGIVEDKIMHVGYTPPKNGERASVITGIELKGKGPVTFFWWPDRSFALTNIGSYTTIYKCYYVDSGGIRTSYMGTSELYFGQDSPYKKWFPYTVLNVKDLEDRYDEIVHTIETFPTGSPLPKLDELPIKMQPVVQAKYSNFTFQVKDMWGKSGSCDLFKY